MSLVIPLPRHELTDEAPASPPVHHTVESLAQSLAATAVERDRAGGHAAHERELIRASGLLTLTIPKAHGGQGADWATMYQALRRLAEVDSALAHLFGFHHLQLAGVRLYGTPDQQSRLLRDTVTQRWFWGNALNPLDKRLRATEVNGGYLLHGTKSFASGSVGSDQLTVSAWHEPTQSLLIGAVPTRRDGVSVQADWDAFGQKQTDSGNVDFHEVLIGHHEVLQAPGTTPTPKATLRSQVAQLVLVNLYLGIGLGAFHEARRYTREEAKPWFASGVTHSSDDPFVQQRYAELWLRLRPAIALADTAAALLDQAFRRGDEVTARDRGEVAIAVAEAKVLAHRAGVEVSSQLFELTGARSTSARYGLDRFWRNVRVHTLHDPIDYKLRDIGRHVLTGAWPEPTAYS
ncbi:acyl-CoA dehydrogenase family protein [Piscinibacter sp. HJYY11]|uniref:acyl-CoA dehydrogenase family protein n=1 Tax=Piscinibacter sp. HJYY11 TaxID=2801333 RepID=UPI00191E3B03|nr:acyl-CoA dehydrogenase family protein [Piscinibacter sp. HJYY11]MBL0728605.1 acyl-CoA dehydrogenase family protein [Piscinibacter sp. HJYY11]